MASTIVSSGVTSSGLAITLGDYVSVTSGGTVEASLISGGVETIFQGGKDSGAQITGSGEQLIQGGIASAAFVASGGVQEVFGGATAGAAIGTTVGDGGGLYVFSGSASGVVVESGGVADVYNGAIQALDIRAGGSAGITNATDTTIESGGAATIADATATTIQSGGVVVASGGTLSQTTVESGATIFVRAGATLSATIVQSGGAVALLPGGTLISTTVDPGGLVVSTGVLLQTPAGLANQGGTASNDTIGPFTTAYVLNHGTLLDAHVSSGGSAQVFLGGVVSAATVGAGGVIDIDSGSASNDIIDGGAEYVSAATATGTTVASGGFQYVSSGIATATTIAAGGTQIVNAGSGAQIGGPGIPHAPYPIAASNTVVQNGGHQIVTAGGLASATTIDRGGAVSIDYNGQANGADVTSGGALFLSAGGSAVSTTVAAGGLLVLQGGTATGTDLQSGGQIVSTGILLDTPSAGFTDLGGVEAGLAIGSGATATVLSDGLLAGANLAPGGQDQVFSGGTASGTRIASGAIEIIHQGGVASASVISAGGLDYIADGGTLTGATLQTGGAIQIEQFAYAPTQSLSFAPATDTLTLFNQGFVETTLQLAGAYTNEAFTLAQPGTGAGTLIEAIACYCAGTRIRTPSGDVPIETLAIGDIVCARSGERPIRWIGRRSYSGRFAAGNPDVLPIRIQANALADGIPARDLHLSPLHALYLDGALIPAIALVNGVSITQAESIARVDYLHLELETHDVILAEGALAETFVDDHSRGMFHNAADYAARYPAAPRPPAQYCAPRLAGGPEIEAIRRRLAARATPTPATGPFQGAIDRVTQGSITGWIIDDANPTARVRIRLRDHGVVLGAITADQYRPDLHAAGGNDGRHGFEFSVPGGLSRLHDHAITIEPIGGSLIHPPALLPAAAAAPSEPAIPHRLRAAIDLVARDRILGWAYDTQPPHAPVAIQVLNNGAPIASLLANHPRRDLAQAGIGTGRHGFEHSIPGGLSPLQRHVIELRHEADGVPLAPPIILEPADSFDSSLEATLHNAINGLASPAEASRVLNFLTAQAERLRQRQAAPHPTTPHAPLRAPAPLKALVIDDTPPDPTRDAGSQAILSHLRALHSLGYAVSFAPADLAPAPALPPEITPLTAPAYASVEEILRRHAGQFDLIYLHRVSNAAAYLTLARRHQPAARLLYAVADLHHLRLARQAAHEARPELLAEAHRIRQLEATAAALADAVLTHSPAEAATLRALVPAAQLHIVPWAIPHTPAKVPFAKRRGVAFIGHYAHKPNADAARFLATEIMPLVWRHDPAIPCLLVGAAPPPDLHRLASPTLRILGQIPDLDALLAQIRLTAAPLRYGAGIKGKVLASLAAGIPCVLTPIAAEGLPDLAATTATTAEDLAALILSLHRAAPAWRRAAKAGAAVGKAYTQAATVTALEQAVGKARPGALPPSSQAWDQAGDPRGATAR